MKRTVEPELLDQLPPADPAAQEARRDLGRINSLMGNGRILTRALKTSLGDHPPREILELGAGDGRLLLQVARRLAPRWNQVQVRLLDRVSVVEFATIDEFRKLGWNAAAISGDVLDWFHQQQSSADIVVANLFMHHFVEPELRTLLAGIARSANVFIAVEPRRASLPLLASSFLWAIGCNPVARHDAVKSVWAGFAGQELSRLWPAADEWQLTERSAGLFTHLFVARRVK